MTDELRVIEGGGLDDDRVAALLQRPGEKAARHPPHFILIGRGGQVLDRRLAVHPSEKKPRQKLRRSPFHHHRDFPSHAGEAGARNQAYVACTHNSYLHPKKPLISEKREIGYYKNSAGVILKAIGTRAALNP